MQRWKATCSEMPSLDSALVLPQETIMCTLNVVNSHRGSFLARTCNTCENFQDRFSHRWRSKLFFWRCCEGFDVVVFSKWWMCFFCFTYAVCHVIREFICRWFWIILALSSHVRCFFLSYILSPLRACLTVAIIQEQRPQASSITLLALNSFFSSLI